MCPVMSGAEPEQRDRRCGGIDLRAETRADEAFLMSLFASTRAEELACLAAAPAAREMFVRLQYQAQKRAYDSAYPSAERSIIEIEGAAAGRLYVDRTADEIRLVDIALLPEHRRRGAGTTLLNTLLEEARRSGRRVTLHVLRGSPAARLYQRLGFVRTSGTDMHDAMEWQAG